MMFLIPKKEKKIAPFTIKKNIFYQYVFFPLVFTLFVFAPLAFYAILFLFIGAYVQYHMVSIILFACAAVIAAFLSGLILADKVRAVAPKTAEYNRLSTLIAPAIHTIAIFIAYLAGGIQAAKMTTFIVNPLFIVVNLLCESILENSIVMVMFLASLSYTATFLFFTRRAYQGKRQVKIFALITAIVMTFALLTCTYTVYPDVEYEILKRKYASLTFDEEVDYKFYQNLPFDTDNKLVKINEPPAIDFPDVLLAPRLDGATAFYPVYAAIAENCYSGLKAEMENNELYFHSYYGESNIFLAIPYEQQDDPLLNRCAELIRCTQTTNAYNGLADGKSDIVFAFEPSDEQIAYAAEKGVTFELTPIGYDAFCFFVNQKNPVNELTLREIQQIYSGKTTNWKKVGGKNKRIFAFTRPKNSGSQTIMENVVMKDIAIRTRFETKVVRTMGQIIHVVDGYLNTRAAIGYTFMYYSSFMVSGESIKYLAIDGVAPTSENVRSGAYRFSTPFYAVTVKGQETAETLELLDWLQGTQGQDLIKTCGYVGL